MPTWVILLIASSLSASQTFAQGSGTGTVPEMSTEPLVQAYDEQRDQKQAAVERDSEVSEITRQGLSKAYQVIAPAL